MSAVVSLSLGGCAKKSEKSESPAKEQTTNEHPEHPTTTKEPKLTVEELAISIENYIRNDVNLKGYFSFMIRIKKKY